MACSQFYAMNKTSRSTGRHSMIFRGRPLFITIIVLVAGAGLVAAFSILNPTPPHSVTMSTGPAGSAYAELAEQYREHFAANGITLELRGSGGAQENLERLVDQNDDVEVAFITMGSLGTLSKDSLYSLGAMFYEPLWVFSSDDEIANRNLSSASEKKISIGLPGSRSNSAARQLFRLLGFAADDIPFVELDPQISVGQLKDGSIDAIIMVTNAATPLVRDLLASPEVTLVDFVRADAYTALYPQLKKLVVPAGVGSLAKNLPPKDVNILASTAILAVRRDIHPAIQTLLLDAASNIHSSPDLFHADGRFPSTNTFRIPLSPDASRYYTSGRPFLQRFLPFWLAILVMQILVAALPLLGLIYPALKLMPSAFEWAMRRRIFLLYGELRLLESELPDSISKGTVDEFVEKLDALESKVRNLKVPNTFSNLVFGLRAHVNVVRARIPSGT